MVGLAMVVLMLGSGCLDPAGSDSKGAKGKDLKGTPVGSAAARVLPTTLEVPKVVKALLLGSGAGEPNIAVAPDGTIYVTPITRLYRSTDGGKSFKDLGAKTTGTGDGDIVVDGTGRLHWLGLGGGSAGPIPYQYSDNQGESWTAAKDLSSKTGGDREWLDATPDGVIYTSWRGRVGGQGVISVNVSMDGGSTWPNKLATMSSDGVGGPIVHGNAPGEVYEAISMFSTGTGAANGKILLARSFDYGAKWETKLVAVPAQHAAQAGLIGFPTSIFPVVAQDAVGTLYVVYSADQQSMTPFRQDPLPKPLTRFGVYLTTSKDQGDTWSPPKLISDPSKAAVMPWVAAGAKGRIAVTWYENVNGIPSDVLPDFWHASSRRNPTTSGTSARAARAAWRAGASSTSSRSPSTTTASRSPRGARATKWAARRLWAAPWSRRRSSSGRSSGRRSSDTVRGPKHTTGLSRARHPIRPWQARPT
ncbi:MAG: exo-alpha-sialidase [Euryarchaeota archaeon]|nr:exo-alpha-sialidase [Euryarchaeota archaeon]